MSQVFIKHPDIDALGGPVPESAFTSLWEGRGWSLATDDEVADHLADAKERTERVATLTAEDVDGITRRADLDQLALDSGVDPTQHSNMDSLRDAIKTKRNL